MEESDIYTNLAAGDAEKALELINAATQEDITALRSQDGKTLAHAAVHYLPNNSEIISALVEKGVNPALKDQEGKSALELMIATEEGLATMKEHIKLLLNTGSTDKLQQWAMAGWKLPISDEDLENLSPEAKEIVKKIQELQDQITNVFAAIVEDRLEDLKAIPDIEGLLQAHNILGLLPLHAAVVHENTEIVQQIIKAHPAVINSTDNVNRTALHIAAVCPDDGNIYQLLTDAGADETIKDVRGKTPTDYKAEPGLLSLEDIISKVMSLLREAQSDSKKDSRPASSADKAAEGESPQAAVDEPDSNAPIPEAEPEPPTTPPKPSTPPKPATPPGPKVHKPIEMYVDKPSEQKAPPPHTVDGKYIAQHLGSALTVALAEIAEKRPLDPIDYLANWLYKYHENTSYNRKKEELLQSIRDEEAKLNEEEILKFKRQEELKRIQEEEAEQRKLEEEERKRKEQEELQRSAKEAALAQKPQLPTVTEEGEGEEGAANEEEDDDPSVKDRDENGLTEMHKLATQDGMDLEALIQLGYSIADRDQQGRTVRDVALAADQKETVQAIDNYLKRMLEDGRTDILEQLALDGYGEELEQMSSNELPEITKSCLERLIGLREMISSTFKAAEGGDETEVKDAVEAQPKLVQAKDKDGRSLLHLAVLAKATLIVEYIVTNFPQAVKARDNTNRTPLHYASAISEEIAQTLITQGASTKAKDAMKKTPSYYGSNKGEIVAIQQKLGLVSATPAIAINDEEAQETGDPAAAGGEDEGPTQLATVVSEQPAADQEQEKDAPTEQSTVE